MYFNSILEFIKVQLSTCSLLIKFHSKEPFNIIVGSIKFLAVSTIKTVYSLNLNGQNIYLNGIRYCFWSIGDIGDKSPDFIGLVQGIFFGLRHLIFKSDLKAYVLAMKRNCGPSHANVKILFILYGSILLLKSPKKLMIKKHQNKNLTSILYWSGSVS